MQAAPCDEKSSLPNQLQKHRKTTILQIKHSGRGSDAKARISTGFHWHENFRKYHQGKWNCESYFPMKNSCTVWKAGEQISPRTLMFSLALAPRQVRYAGKLRLLCLLRWSEVQQLHPENDMQQAAQPSSCLAALWARAPSAGKLQPASNKYICHCLDDLKQALANILRINIKIWLCTTSSDLHMSVFLDTSDVLSAY